MQHRFAAVRAAAGKTARRLGRRAARRLRGLWTGAGRLVREVRTEPAAQERAAAAAVFATIFAVLVGGVDYLVTGGPSWNPAAAAAPSVAVTRVDAPAWSAEPAALPQRPAVEAAEIDYSFTDETLLGGPEVVLAAAEQAASGAELVAASYATGGYSPFATVPKLDTAAALSVSLDAALW